jgi:hypothetical protein
MAASGKLNLSAPRIAEHEFVRFLRTVTGFEAALAGLVGGPIAGVGVVRGVLAGEEVAALTPADVVRVWRLAFARRRTDRPPGRQNGNGRNGHRWLHDVR